LFSNLLLDCDKIYEHFANWYFLKFESILFFIERKKKAKKMYDNFIYKPGGQTHSGDTDCDIDA